MAELEPGDYTFKYQAMDAWDVSERMKSHAIKVNGITEGTGSEMIADVTVPALISYPDDSLTWDWKRKSGKAFLVAGAAAGLGALWLLLGRKRG